MIPQKAQQILNLNRFTWDKIDNNYVNVCFHGMLDENCVTIENELFKLGLYAIKRTYNKKLKKTFTTYRIGLK